ncbi:DUF2955 domain-containing protein [Noviluteimonas gilva]|uniref:DUF2955 domain-containing protein n=1 Tax=Noviluteimonas gilva TaxID=2682097 RepID=A0A7C9HRJ2_9GAMM|nr:DUF2955 domain-containing protein [Lysobacter gilvus]MUV13691.1 DUF2955 domain-containing protein [Lysobacter gilvus]
MKQDRAQWHATLRFAVGVTVAFVACELLRWSPSFLAAALTVALLGNLPVRLSPKLAIGLLISISFAALLAFLLSVWFRDTPVILFGLLGLCVLLAYHKMLGGGSPLPPLLMLICLAVIPVIALTAPPYAHVLPLALVRGMLVALAVIALVWIVWPEPIPPKPPAPPPVLAASPLSLALRATAVILPLMLVYLLFGLVDVLPVMIATVMLVANFDPGRGRLHALGMVAGNFVGGLMGFLMHAVLLTTPNVPFLATLLFVVTLAFGARIAVGGSLLPVYVITCNAMLIIFGQAIAEGSSSLSLWLVRLFQFSVAGAFAVVMMGFAWHRVPRPAASA